MKKNMRYARKELWKHNKKFEFDTIEDSNEENIRSWEELVKKCPERYRIVEVITIIKTIYPKPKKARKQ